MLCIHRVLGYISRKLFFLKPYESLIIMGTEENFWGQMFGQKSFCSMMRIFFFPELFDTEYICISSHPLPLTLSLLELLQKLAQKLIVSKKRNLFKHLMSQIFLLQVKILHLVHLQVLVNYWKLKLLCTIPLSVRTFWSRIMYC